MASPLSPRPPLKRQESSYATPGRVHNMAVMVKPVRVDYSVRGGTRSWLVTLIFVLLCSAMISIFSDDQQSKVKISSGTVDDDDDEVVTGRVADEEQHDQKGEHAEQIVESKRRRSPTHQQQSSGSRTKQKRSKSGGDEESSAPASDDDGKARGKEMSRSKSAAAKRPPDSPKDDSDEKSGAATVVAETAPVTPPSTTTKTSDDEDDAEGDGGSGEVDLEQILFAKLRAKAQQFIGEAREQQQRLFSWRNTASERIRRKKQQHHKHQQDDGDEEDTHSHEEPQQKGGKEEEKDLIKDAGKKQRIEPEEDERPIKDEEPEPSEDSGREEEAEPVDDRPKRTKRKQKETLEKERAAATQDTGKTNPQPRTALLKHKKKPKPPEILPLFSSRSTDDEDSEQQSADEEEIREIVAVRKRTGIYNRKAVTNRDDYKVRHELDAADFALEKHEFKKAVAGYNAVLRENPESPRAHFGLGRVAQLRAEFDTSEDSEQLLDQALAEYEQVLEGGDTPDELFRVTAENFIACAKLRSSNLHRVIAVQRSLVDKFPDEVAHQLNFGISFLSLSRPEDAKHIFKNILQNDPSHSVAQAYLGYIIKVHDGDVEKGVHLMRRGLRALAKGGDVSQLVDPKFFFHLGDGLVQLGRSHEAHRVYAEAVRLGIFPSVFQRSLHNLEGLVAKPWWSLEQMECQRQLRQVEKHWTVVREEAVAVMNKQLHLFEKDDRHCEAGSLLNFWTMRNGQIIQENCAFLPATCELVKNLLTGSKCVKDEIKISLMHAGTALKAHCGPLNYILEADLGLVTSSDARIRVGQESRGWKPGRFLIRDTSFETEVTFEGAPAGSIRLILSVQLWHPQVPHQVRSSIAEDSVRTATTADDDAV